MAVMVVDRHQYILSTIVYRRLAVLHLILCSCIRRRTFVPIPLQAMCLYPTLTKRPHIDSKGKKGRLRSILGLPDAVRSVYSRTDTPHSRNRCDDGDGDGGGDGSGDGGGDSDGYDIGDGDGVGDDDGCGNGDGPAMVMVICRRCHTEY